MEEPLDTADLRRRFSRSVEAGAAGLEDERYFADGEAPGLQRLRSHLQESAFWSKGLYEAASRRSFRAWGLVTVSILLVGYFAQPFAGAGTAQVVARAMVVFLAFVAAADGFGQAFAWAAAARQADAVDRRLERLDAEAREALLAAFADYSVTTASAPPIPAGVYRAERERLNALWRDRKASASNSAESAVSR